MNDNDINEFIPSILNPRSVKKDRRDTTLTQNSVVSRCSLSLRRNNGLNKSRNIPKILTPNKENSQNVRNLTKAHYVVPQVKEKEITNIEIENAESLGFSAIQDLDLGQVSSELSPLSFLDVGINEAQTLDKKLDKEEKVSISIISGSSATELDDCLNDANSDKTLVYECSRPVISVSFGISECKKVDVSTNNSYLKRVFVSTENNDTTVDCELIESSQISSESNLDENMNEAILPSPQKKSAVAVNLEIKTKKVSDSSAENSKVLILNTDAIQKVSHVIIQPPNYKIVKRQNTVNNKIRSGLKRKSLAKNGKVNENLKQRSIEEFFSGRAKANVLSLPKVSRVRTVNDCDDDVVVCDVDQDMSRVSGVSDTVQCDSIRRGSCKLRRDNASPRAGKVFRRSASPRCQQIKLTASDAPHQISPRSKIESSSLHSPRKNVESVQFSLPSKSMSAKNSIVPKNIPHHKIVAGTHFAVDAFSYGEIPNVMHYFLTHFHSDHYCGLKKGFNKLLFCSKITADLCVSRLGVSPKVIHIINPDESLKLDGVEITAVDANHCPGALMLVFTLPNGKTMLHTGDFRASPVMESYPVFWNKDIHTIYLDTTYCNPRYDFPTQEQSLEMALHLLRQKKSVLEKAGKEFSSVLIICGTYTIGKEKFFLGLARRVGCTVWACPEKDRVLQAVEGRSFSHAPPQSCQLHVVPMRDLTHEKLRSYLDSLQGAFSEVVAFKPSGWENGKNASVQKDLVTIHGIPYSEHSSFSEMIRFVKFLKPKQVVPTVDISGGAKAVQKYFPCPLVYKEEISSQSKVTDFFSIQNRQQVPAVT